MMLLFIVPTINLTRSLFPRTSDWWTLDINISALISADQVPVKSRSWPWQDCATETVMHGERDESPPPAQPNFTARRGMTELHESPATPSLRSSFALGPGSFRTGNQPREKCSSWSPRILRLVDVGGLMINPAVTGTSITLDLQVSDGRDGGLV